MLAHSKHLLNAGTMATISTTTIIIFGQDHTMPRHWFSLNESHLMLCYVFKLPSTFNIWKNFSLIKQAQ